MEAITLQDALAVIRTRDKAGKPFPFDCTYRTFNSQTKKGGKLLKIFNAKYLPPKKEGSQYFDVFRPEKNPKDPNHDKNRTINVELENGDIATIRFDFLITINKKQIIY